MVGSDTFLMYESECEFCLTNDGFLSMQKQSISNNPCV